MGWISEFLEGLRGREAAAEDVLAEPLVERDAPPVEERNLTAEEQVRFEHEHAARFVSDMTPKDRAFVFQCFDEMWEENGKQAVYLPANRPLYHAGLVREKAEVEDWPMFLSPEPKGCDSYSGMVNSAMGEVRSALVVETTAPRRLADFSASTIDFSNPGSTPMGRLTEFTGAAADKTRAHLARAWCTERRIDGYERRNADEILIASPRESLRTLEALDMDSFRGKYLTSKKPSRARPDEER